MTCRLVCLEKVLVCLLVSALTMCAVAQTYKVGDEETEKQGEQKPSQKSLGWGSNIQNARLARAAETALRSGNYAAAVDYAQRAVQATPGDSQLWFLLGYAARLAGKSSLSVDAFDRGLQIAPSSLEGQSGLAQTYAKMGRRNEAESLLNRVLAADPKRSNDAQALGEILVQSGRYDDAIAILSRSEQARPHPRTELLLALSYQHLKKLDEANRYLEMARKRSPNDPDVQHTLAGFYRETGNYEAAITALRGLPHKTPEINAELAYTCQLDGKRDEAAKLYVQAADAAPQDLQLQLAAAQAQLSVENIDGAGPFLKRASKLDPENYRLHAIRGQVAMLEDRSEDAVTQYKSALEHMPQAPPEGPLYAIQIHLNLMGLYKNLLAEAEAQQELENVRAAIGSFDDHGPSRPDFLRLRALIRINSGDLAGADADIKEAVSINDKDPNNLQLAGDVLVKSGHPEEAAALYRKVLAIDSGNRSALTAMGYLSREAGHEQEAEKYFQRLAAADPRSPAPYLAMGDMYTARREFAKAEAAYRKGHDFAPHNSLIVAGAMNAAIEDHHFPLAGQWLSRATEAMQREPHLLREKERYYTWIGEYQRSIDAGRQAMQKLPKDRDVVVYYGYDLLHLQRYDELLQLTGQYRDVLPKEPDLPLLAGYVHKHAGQLSESEQDFSRVIDLDPQVVTAYVNRGFVRNDMKHPQDAAKDFEAALQLDPKDGEAHLGLASSSLALHRPQVALRQAQLAEAQLGDSMSLHLIRGTAYGQTGALAKSVTEFQAALKYSPNDARLHIALAESQYGLHHYREAIAELEAADKLAPGDAAVYGQMARSYAQLRDRDQTLHYVDLSEQHFEKLEPEKQSEILVSNGEALALFGDQDAAMKRFERSLVAPQSDKVAVRLAIARLMANRGEVIDARRQIALALMEAQSGETAAPTGGQYLQAADLFLQLHDFQLAQKYFEYALTEGAPETTVRIGLANSYLAEGDTARAQGQITLLSSKNADSDPSYQFLLAKAAVLRQEHQNARALTAFAQAAQAAGQDEVADRELLAAGGDEGLRINHNLSFLSTFSVMPVFEDTTVYPLDAKLDTLGSAGQRSALPLPRSSIETQWTGAYHLHFDGLPDFSGFVQTRNAQGQISLPNANTVVNRNTTDYSFNFGVNPTVRIGSNVFTFSGGIQETVRRDSRDPVDMDQNLFRQFLYVSTSSFFNLISISGYAIHESGPFTLSLLHSRDVVGSLEFKVGRPWGKTALVTGVGARDEQFDPVIREFYYTSTYAGIERKFSDRFRLRAVAEHLRSWRVEGDRYAIAQALRPAASVEFVPKRNWSVQGNFSYSRNMAFHEYDAVQSGFAVSYAKPVGRIFREGVNGGDVELRYPIRFSFGLQQEDFFDFPGANSRQFRPFVSVSLF